jgi:hypothetical protein
MFGNWLWGISKEMKSLVMPGAGTTCCCYGFAGMILFLKKI